MKYASVCSGVEAASLAWSAMGWEPVWFSEIEKFPCEVLKYRFPDVPNLGDMTKIRMEEREDGQMYYGEGSDGIFVPGGIDLLVGGTPCQGFSVAGKQGGLGDERSGLAMRYVEMLGAFRPEWFVWENVPGVFSTNNGNDIREFLGAIAELGYCVSWRVLDAQYVRVDGYPRAVPQRRRRVIAVGRLGADWRYPAKVLFDAEGVHRDTPPRRETRKSPSGDACGRPEKAGSRIGFYPSQHHQPKTCETPTLTCDNCSRVRGDTPYVLESEGMKEYTERSAVETGRGFYRMSSSGDACGRPEEAVCSFQQNQLGELRTHSVSGSLATNSNASGRGTAMVVQGLNDHGGRAETHQHLPLTADCAGWYTPSSFGGWAEGVGTLRASGGDLGSGSETPAIVAPRALQSAVRRLTPLECERLMGFPDYWTRIPVKRHPAKPSGKRFNEFPDLFLGLPDGSWLEYAPDGPRYKACGNSMCVNVMRWVGRRIEKVESEGVEGFEEEIEK